MAINFYVKVEKSKGGGVEIFVKDAIKFKLRVDIAIFIKGGGRIDISRGWN